MSIPHLVTSQYNVDFSGKTIETIVTDKASIVEDWVCQVRSIHNGKRLIVGLDCEWRSPEIWEADDKVATLQLCVDNKCLIFQLYYMDYIPESLESFLCDFLNTFVGVEVDDDVSKLKDEYGLYCRRTADLRELASRRKPNWSRLGRKPGLKSLASMIVGLNMEKPKNVSKSDWQARVLTEEQIRYACIDAYASYRIGHKLLRGS